MDEDIKNDDMIETPADMSRRAFIKGVNGQQRRVDVSRQETLAWTLRYKLGLTGTKLGCDRASAARAPSSSMTYLPKHTHCNAPLNH